MALKGKPASEQTKQRQARAKLTVKQAKFVKAYAHLGNGRAAAKAAGYSDSSDHVLEQQAHENLRKPEIAAAAQREIARIVEEVDFSAGRVRRRLDQLSLGAEACEQFATAVRAEELIGKAAGMFIDQSLVLRGDLSGDHLAALVEVARARQAHPPELHSRTVREDRITRIVENRTRSDK